MQKVGIKKAIKVPQAAEDAFINEAPDAAKAKPAGVIRGKKQIITVGFAPELLDRIDAKATENGISRAAMINLACSKAVAE